MPFGILGQICIHSPLELARYINPFKDKKEEEKSDSEESEE